MKKMRIKLFTLSLIGLACISVFLAACTRPGSGIDSITGGHNVGSGENVVHMNSAQFLLSNITIKKGASLTLIDDVAVPHDVFNGAWVNDVAQEKTEKGAPTVQLQFAGNDSQNVGPFTTVGTFKLYCSVHTGMNLTVIVQ